MGHHEFGFKYTELEMPFRHFNGNVKIYGPESQERIELKMYI